MQMENCARFTGAEGGARLAAAARTRNTLAADHTTFIATTLLHEDAYKIRGSLSDGSQRSVYVTRESRVKCVSYDLSILTDLAVCAAVDYGEVSDWSAELEKNEVLVCTSQVIKRVLNEGVLAMGQVNMLILDSCHLICQDDDLKFIMNRYKECDEKHRPRILALTYPLFSQNKKDNIEHSDKTDEDKTENTEDSLSCSSRNCNHDDITEDGKDSDPFETKDIVPNADKNERDAKDNESDKSGNDKDTNRSDDDKLWDNGNIGVHVNADDFEMYEKLEWKIDVLEAELCCQADFAEDIDNVKRLSTSICKPKELIVEYKKQVDSKDLPKSYVELEDYMRAIVADVMQFFTEHRYDLTEIYGDAMYEEFKGIPDPTLDPKEIFGEFIYVLDQLGPYGADKAAFSLLIKLEKLKIKIPYERHFLLLCVCTSVLVQIRCVAESVFQNYENDWDKIKQFCTPKVLRFVEILEQFKPNTVDNSPKSATEHDKNSPDKDDADYCSKSALETDETTDKDATDLSKSPLESDKDGTDDIGKSPMESDDGDDKDKECASDSKSPLEPDKDGTDIGKSAIESDEEQECASDEEKDVHEKTNDMLKDIETCDFLTLSNKIEDQVHTYEGNLREINELPTKSERDNCGATENQISEKDNCGVKEKQMDERQAEVLRNGPFGFNRRGHRLRGRGRILRTNAARLQQMQANPDALCGIVFMKEPLMAKILFMLVVELSRNHPNLSFLCTQYCAIDRPADPVKEPRDFEQQRKRQEDVLKKFRMHECNLLLATSALEEGIDLPRCNLVLRWDAPASYRSYGLCRGRARAPRSVCAVLSAGDAHAQRLVQHVATYRELDQIISRKCGCGVQNEPSQAEEDHADAFTALIKPYTPLTATTAPKDIPKDVTDNENDKNTSDKSRDSPDVSGATDCQSGDVGSDSCEVTVSEVTASEVKVSEVSDTIASVDLSTAVALINRYCGKLPSDTFTRLTPQWTMEEVELPLKRAPGVTRKAFICTLRLPLNCPVKYNIVGHPMPTRVLARRVVALQACRILHKSGELDNQLMPIGKENFRAPETAGAPPVGECQASGTLDPADLARPGTTKRRQYYYKRTAWAFTDCQPIIDTEDSELVAEQKVAAEERKEVSEQVVEEKVVAEGRTDVSESVAEEKVATQGECRQVPELVPEKKMVTEGECGQVPELVAEEKVATEAERAKAPIEDQKQDIPKPLGAESKRNRLYAVRCRLWCALPERYNTRGRRLHAPQHARHALGVLMARAQPGSLHIPAFPVYTRSGEVRVSVEPVLDADVRMSPRRGRLVRRFMRFVFAEVLRVRRRGMKLQSEGTTHNNYYIVPTVKTTRDDGSSKIDIDWSFLELIYQHTETKKYSEIEKPVLWHQDEEELEKDRDANTKDKSGNGMGIEKSRDQIGRTTNDAVKAVDDPNKAVPVTDKAPVVSKVGNMRVDTRNVSDNIVFRSTRNGKVVKRLRNPLLGPDEIFSFDPEKYKEAVVTPWYRNQDQPQFFLVAEICWNLSPDSAFPSDTHTTFRNYYTKKYGVELTQPSQPLLDVDHTSARLNLLTPRYVNRKGVALPVSSERTRRAKRDRLDQKQILVPELCRVHPFAAPLWFATVALPCVLYRINALLIADEIRRCVAIDVGLGIPKVDEVSCPGFEWPALDFGWSLAEVLNVDEKRNEDSRSDESGERDEVSERTANDILQEKEDAEGFEIGTWSNDMASSIPMDNDYSDFMEPLPANLTFCTTSASGGTNWCEPAQSSRSAFNHSRAFSVADSDCSYLSSDFDTDDSDLDSGNSDDDTETSGFCSSRNSNVAMGVRIEYKTAHEAEAVDLMCEKKRSVAPQPDREADALDRAHQEAYLKGGAAPPEYIDRFRKAVDNHKNRIIENNLLVKEDESILSLLPELKVSSGQSANTECTSLEDLFPYDIGAEIMDSGVVNLTTVERSKRVLLEKLRQSLSMEEIGKLNCFSMVDVDIDSPGYVNEKVVNIGFDTQERYVKRLNSTDLSDYKFDLETYHQERKAQGKKRDFDFDFQPKLEGHPGPSPSVILQALTMSNANDGINLERLETIGDSFLKFAITAYLYCAHPAVHEGKLSHMRSKQVSNLSLYRLGRNKHLGARMIASKFEPHDNWLPPCHKPPPTLGPRTTSDRLGPGASAHCALHGAHRPPHARERCTCYAHGVADAAGCFIPYNLITQHSIPDKSIADCVEALIGAYLIECGPRGALLFMSWLGIRVLPRHDVPLAGGHAHARARPARSPRPAEEKPPQSTARVDSSSSSEWSEGEEGEEAERAGAAGGAGGAGAAAGAGALSDDWSWAGRAVGSLRPYRGPDGWLQPVFGELKAPPSPLLRYIEDPDGELEQMLSGYDVLERTLQYRFRDRSLLLQALTHASHHQNRLTDCYQRLEFLGDAILDYLITRYLYEDERRHSPGALTDLRSALVNNTIFATLAVRHGFHKYFRHMSPGLNEVLTKYVKIQEENGHSISEEHYLIQEDELEQAEDVEVPKALGDLFESVAGAIFLDSGMSLGAVWRSYVRLMGAELEAFSAAAPKSPVRELLEAEPDTAKFGKPERLADGRKVRVCVEVFGRGTFKGVGRNYRIAKGTAARCALRHLKRAHRA